ncbi:MAG: hypothetical protein D8M59_03600 [Planctomycetes bacterium]|nr:hypothetical protein [Planctomycetota bacterium]NOG53082.1 hypothetical protein [Planctomycetota bacterium]
MCLRRIISHALRRRPVDVPSRDAVTPSIGLGGRLALLVVAWSVLCQPGLAPAIAFSWPGPEGDSPAPAKSVQDGFAYSRLERVVASFDFDEPDNPFPVPDRWVRINEHGYPKWNYGLCEFDPPEPVAGGGIDRSYRLAISGGSSGIRLVQGVVAAIPMTDYSLRAQVRTEDLVHARAMIRACFVDEKGRPIDASRASTLPAASEGVWSEVRLTLSGRFENAAWIQVDLLLIQPEQWQDPERFAQEVRHEDVAGRAWFNDVVITRLPRIELAASDSNIVAASDPVELTILVQDASAASLTGRLMVLDQTGTLVEEATLTDIETDKRILWSPAVSRFGWYRVILEVWESETLAGRSYVDFAYVPQRGANVAVGSNRFGVVADNDPELSWIGSVDLLHDLGARSIVVPVYGMSLQADHMKAHRARLEPAVDRLLRLGHELTFNLTAFPTQVADQLSSKGLSSLNVFEVLSAGDGDAWSFLDPLLIGFGQRVPGWLIGSSVNSTSYLLPDVPDRLDAFESRISEVVPDPRVFIPWPSDYQLPGVPSSGNRLSNTDALSNPIPSSVCGYQLIIPDAFDASASADLVGTVLDRPTDIQVLIDSADVRLYGWAWAAADLTRKACLIWERLGASYGPDPISGSSETIASSPKANVTLAVRQPWVQIGLQRTQAVPTPAYPVWRNIIQHLSGRRPVGRLDLGDGVIAVIYEDRDEPSQGTICLWNESDRADAVEARMFLGTGRVQSCDLVGNTEDLPLIDGEHRVTIGRTPMFIDGADIQLAMFRAGFRVTPSFVDTGTQVHDHIIHLSNPWQTTLAGQLRIDEPESWKYKQRVLSFSVPAGQTVDIPFSFATPIFELAGTKELVVEATVSSSGLEGVPSLRLAAPIEVGYRRIILQAAHHYATAPDGTEFLIVTEEITNDSDEPVWLEAFALAKGHPYQRADIGNLQPGHRATRMFRFQISRPESQRSGRPSASEQEPLTQVRVGLRELNGPGRVNQIVEVAPSRYASAAAGDNP